MCAFLAALLAGAAALSAGVVAGHVLCFGANGLVNSKEVGLIDSLEFKSQLNGDIQTIIDDVSHNENQAAYDAAKAATVERALEFAQYALPYVQQYNAEVDEYYNSNSYADYPYFDVPDYEQYGVTGISPTEYFGENISQLDFSMDVQGDENNSDTVNFSIGDIDNYNASGVRDALNSQFGNQQYYTYCHNTAEAGESADMELLNVRYFAQYADSGTAYNVDDPQAFAASVKNGEGEYFIYENGKSASSEKMSGIEVIGGDYYADTADNVRLYISVDPTFAQDDYYGRLNSRVEGLAGENASAALYAAVFAVMGCIAFAVISVRLAGNSASGEKSAALADRLPCDIHAVLTAGAAAGLIIPALMLITGRINTVFDVNPPLYFSLSSEFFESQWYINILFALGAAVYLVLLQFGVSVARNAKTGVNLLKHTVIYKLCVLGLRLIKRIGRAVKKSNSRIKRFFSTVSFRPERLEKRAVQAVLLFSLFNICATALAALFFSNSNYSFAAFAIGWLILALCLAADAYCVYRAFKFMRTLDMLIDRSAKNEPVDMDLSAVPQSLKTLAQSLDEKNARLQGAVIKAVKDERTKTELITNVSHDLKTPLTSVINYIDLLKKCDIKDDTARKYMGVIAEKANRLKRLIEDLIEASKVSTGNVVLNKTKINLNELAAQAIVEETADIEKNNLQIIFDESAQKHIVFADGTKIYRVFENLLSNARKYSAPGSRIYARLFSGREYGCFEIKNISKDPLNITAEELTERFVRGDRARSEEGNGLGLSIAKELCRLNGGLLDIVIDGDLFKATVMLPLSAQEEAEDEAKP